MADNEDLNREMAELKGILEDSLPRKRTRKDMEERAVLLAWEPVEEEKD